MKIILIGYGHLSEALLKGILKTNHEVVGLISWRRRFQADRWTNTLFPDGLEKIRRKAKIPEINVKKVNSFEFVEIASSLKPDIILVGSWGEILKQYVIDIPEILSINCHPSYLPAHRGCNPYTSVLLQNEEYTGVTFHEIDTGIDTGRIITQKKIPLNIIDNGETVRLKCANAAENLVVELLERIENNTYTLTEQNSQKASYYKRNKVENGAISWQDDAITIHNKIRGLYPWIKSYTFLKDKLILVKSSEIVELDNTNYLPGEIISKSGNSAIVNTINKDKAIKLNNLKVFGLNYFLSALYFNKYLIPGRCLQNQE